MELSRSVNLSLLAVSTLVLAMGDAGAATAAPPPAPAERCLVIGHRGASGYQPEHTLQAYTLAIRLGAAYIEPDLVITKDGELIARHDNVLDLTTDVADHPEFAERRTVKMVDGVEIEGWFSEDFTLAEIKTLRAIERIPESRPRNTDYDDLFQVPTLQEVIDLVKDMELETGRTIGIYPETKHPTYFRLLGLPLERRLVDILHANGYRRASDPVFIQSFEVRNLMRLNRMTDLRLVQLLWLEGQPYDAQHFGLDLTYDDMATPEGLRRIARYADGVGPEKNYFIIPLDEQGNLDIDNATTFVDDAHAAGLVVHPYTFRAENEFLPLNYRSDTPEEPNPIAPGNVVGEIKVFLATGIDGLFTDQVDRGVRACREFTLDD